MATTTSAVELSKGVTAFLKKPKQILIEGEWIDSASGKTFETYNPATGTESLREWALAEPVALRAWAFALET
jgi:hypothetical protein